MANRIPWDEAETALLIDTYNQVETGQISMREAVPRLSRTLRQRALNAGIIIDDIYRNENGIQMMLGKIRYLMTGGKSGLPNTSRLFLNMVMLYQTDSSAFERTLKAAKEPAAIELPTKETFYEWLRGQEEEQPKQLLSFVEETDAYARKSGLLSDSLLDIQDVGQIERLQEAIRSNLLLHLLQSRKHSRMMEACTWILRYLRFLDSIKTKTAPADFFIDTMRLTGVESDTFVALQSLPEEECISAVSSATMVDAEGKSQIDDLNDYQEDTLVNSTQAFIEDAIKYKMETTSLSEDFPHRKHEIAYTNSVETQGLAPFALESPAQHCIVESPEPKNDKGTTVFDSEVEYSRAPEKTATIIPFDCLQVNFSNTRSFAFTTPVFSSYYGDYFPATTWIEHYVQFLRNLLKDKPTQLLQLSGCSILGKGRTDIGSKEQLDSFVRPKQIADDLYVEANLSASDIVKRMQRLLVLCHIDSKNWVIAYRSSNTSLVRESNLEEKLPPTQSESQTKALEQALSQVTGEVLTAIDPIVKPLNNAGVGFIDNRLTGGNLWIIGGLELRPIVEQFRKHHIHFQYREEGGRVTNGKPAWWTKDTAVLDDTGKREMPTLPIDVVAPSSPQSSSTAAKGLPSQVQSPDERYSRLLVARFPNGFRLNSGIELKRFRTAWQMEYKQELQDDDAALFSKVLEAGVEYEGFVYHLDNMLSIEKREKLLEMINEWLSQGRTTVYFDALFQAFSEQLLDQGINSPGMLRAYLNAINPGHYRLGKEFLSSEASSGEANPLKDLEAYLLSQGAPQSLDSIQTALPHLPQSALLQLLRFQPCFVNSGTGEYFHLDIVDISAGELQQLEQTLKHLVELSHFVSGEEMVAHLREYHPLIMDRYEHISTLGLRKALAILLEQQFSFVGNIISAKWEELSVADIYTRFCQGRQRFTLDELYTLRDNIGPNPTIYFDTVYQNALRVSQGQFVPKKEVRFATEGIDAAISRYCVGDYISIKAVTSFSAFPGGGFPWNHFLLEHYVYEFSPGFRLIHNGFTASQPAGAIVRVGTPYQELRDVLIHDLANNSVPLEKGDILDDFYQKGYIARRRLADIEYIITSAKHARNKRGIK